MVQFQAKQRKLKIDNFLVWLLEWNLFERILIQSYPNLYPSLASDRCLMQECDWKYGWSVVYLYDTKFRVKLANSDDKVAHDCVDINIFVTTLDATAVKFSSTRGVWTT